MILFILCVNIFMKFKMKQDIWILYLDVQNRLNLIMFNNFDRVSTRG